MARYGGTNTGTSATANSVGWSMIAPSSQDVRLMSLEITTYSTASSPGTTLGLGRPGSVGVTPTSPRTVEPFNPSDPTGKTQTCVAWSTPPTAPSYYFRTFSYQASVYEGAHFLFPRGLLVPAAGNLVLYVTRATSPDRYVNIEVEE